MRRLEVTNHGDRTRELEITSYAEIVLAPAADDLAHPSFGKLFVESEYVAESAALLSRRRPRAPDDAEVFAVHVVGLEGRSQGPVEWETDRERFLGRGRGPEDPQALDGRAALRDDRRAPRPHRRACGSGCGWPPAAWPGSPSAPAWPSSRETALALAQRYHDPAATARTFALAFAHARSRLQHLGISGDEALLFDRLASRVLYADASLRAGPEILARGTLGQSGLWAHGVSGDLPILLVRVVSDGDQALVRQALTAQEYWRLKGLAADVVILNEHPVGYLDEVHAHLEALLDDGPWQAWKHRPGGAYLLRRRPHGRARAAPPPRGGPRRPLRRGRDAGRPARPAGAARRTAPDPVAAGPPAPSAPADRAARCSSPRCRRSPSATAWAASPTAAASTWWCSRGPTRRPRPGPTSSPTRTSARWSPPRARPSPGRRTAARTG